MGFTSVEPIKVRPPTKKKTMSYCIIECFSYSIYVPLFRPRNCPIWLNISFTITHRHRVYCFKSFCLFGFGWLCMRCWNNNPTLTPSRVIIHTNYSQGLAEEKFYDQLVEKSLRLHGNLCANLFDGMCFERVIYTAPNICTM